MSSSEVPIRVIQTDPPFAEWLSQLIRRRETLWFLVWKDLKVQYERPIFGFLWSVFQPLIYFGVILSVMHLSDRKGFSDSMPFSLYLICGLAIWNFTTSSILGAINGFYANTGLITKAYFPRIYLVLSPLLKSTIDLFIVLIIITLFAFWKGQVLTVQTWGLLPFTVLTVWVSTAGLSAIAASLVVLNRQIRHAIPVLLYALIFVLPVFYSLDGINNRLLRIIIVFNPIAGGMDSLRACFTGISPAMEHIAIWAGCSLTILATGALLFRRIEKTLADRI